MVSKAEILSEFSLFSVPTGGIGNWLTEDTHDDVFIRLGQVDHEPLPAVQLNQLLILGHKAEDHHDRRYRNRFDDTAVGYECL